jgi:iron complex transport system ATP-binding protein
MEVSGGERQRVLIARSLATQADVLFLEAPTANLDMAHTMDMVDVCQQLARGCSPVGRVPLTNG